MAHFTTKRLVLAISILVLTLGILLGISKLKTQPVIEFDQPEPVELRNPNVERSF